MPESKKLVLRIVVDNLSTDIYAGEHGMFHLPNIVQQKNKMLAVGIKGGDAVFSKLRIRELKSIWKKD